MGRGVTKGRREITIDRPERARERDRERAKEREARRAFWPDVGLAGSAS